MTSEATAAKSGQLGTTLATWVYALDAAGHRPDDPALQAACDVMRNATEDDDFDALGQGLVAAVEVALEGDDFEAVLALAHRLYGADHISTDLGEDRNARVQAARSYQFQSSLPWVARIVARFPDGTIGTHWVMVERVTDVVTCMDPYPWDDLDEEYRVPLVEFLVRWELAGNEALRFV